MMAKPWTTLPWSFANPSGTMSVPGAECADGAPNAGGPAAARVKRREVML